MEWYDFRSGEDVNMLTETQIKRMLSKLIRFEDTLEPLIFKKVDELKNVSEINVEPYVAYGIDKAYELGLKVYEAPSAPRKYADDIVARLAKLTSKPVRKG